MSDNSACDCGGCGKEITRLKAELAAAKRELKDEMTARRLAQVRQVELMDEREEARKKLVEWREKSHIRLERERDDARKKLAEGEQEVIDLHRKLAESESRLATQAENIKDLQGRLVRSEDIVGQLRDQQSRVRGQDWERNQGPDK